MAKKVTIKESMQAHEKLNEYKKALNKANKQKAKAFKALNNALDEEIGKMIWENWRTKEELQADFDSLPDYLKNDIIQQFEEMTEEEKERFKSPPDSLIIDFYNKVFRLCRAIGKNKAMELIKKYSAKIAKSRNEFLRDTINYAHVLNEFAHKYDKNIFDVRLVRGWLYDKQEWENFVIGALNQIHREYLFDELALGLV